MDTSHGASSSRAIPVKEAHDYTNFSTSVGGTIYGTTPGGTRIKYDRNALLFMRNSPLSKTPPHNMPHIPGVTSAPPSMEKRDQKRDSKGEDKKDADELFEME